EPDPGGAAQSPPPALGSLRARALAQCSHERNNTASDARGASYRLKTYPNERHRGGEFPVVVVFLHDLHAPLLQRTVLYTAMTRAKQGCIIVGTATAHRRAVETYHAVQRYTGFAAALQRALPTRHRLHVSA